MVRTPARSPYGTSTNRRAGGLVPCGACDAASFAHCHPERRARGARSRGIPPAAEACGGGPSSAGKRAAPQGALSSRAKGARRTQSKDPAGGESLRRRALLGRDARGPARMRRLGLKMLPTCGKAALKGRWAGMPIDPAVHGSSSCTFTLRNLHKSPGGRVVSTSHLLRACGSRPSRPCGDWCRFRAAGSGLDAPLPCGRPRVRGASARPPAALWCTFSGLLHGRGIQERP